MSSVHAIAPTATATLAGVSAGGRVAKIAELSKQASTLREQLVHAQKDAPAGAASTEPAQSNQANSINQEIVNLQTQIERLILQNQLARLTQADTSSSQANPSGAPQTLDAAGKASQTKNAVNTLNAAHGTQGRDPYHVLGTSSGAHVDFTA